MSSKRTLDGVVKHTLRLCGAMTPEPHPSPPLGDQCTHLKVIGVPRLPHCLPHWPLWLVSSLVHLEIVGCIELRALPPLLELSGLRDLIVRDCPLLGPLYDRMPLGLERVVLSGCTALTSIGGRLEGCTAFATNCLRGPFAGCLALSSIKLPESLSSIGDLAFFECTALAEIKLPSVTRIG